MSFNSGNAKADLTRRLEKKLDEAIEKAAALREKQDKRIDAIDDPKLQQIVRDKKLSFAR